MPRRSAKAFSKGALETSGQEDGPCYSASYVRHLEEINASMLTALWLAHDELHHPGAAQSAGQDVFEVIEAAVLKAGAKL